MKGQMAYQKKEERKTLLREEHRPMVCFRASIPESLYSYEVEL